MQVHLAQVTVSDQPAEAASGSGTIVLVVSEGLEVLLPMAGVQPHNLSCYVIEQWASASSPCHV